MKKIKICFILILIFISLTCCENKKIIKQVENVDIDGDGVYDSIMLYYKDGVILKVNNTELFIYEVDIDQIFDDVTPNRYECKQVFDIYINKNKILIASIVATNKFGTSSTLNCYEYSSGKLNEIWSSDEELNKSIIVESYQKDKNCINVLVGEKKKKIILNDEEEEEYLTFTKNLSEHDGINKYEMDFILVTNYALQDINNDGNKEIITESRSTFGASFISCIYYSIYEFSSNGIKELESWFNSAQSNKADMINLKEY